jgi:hypothetical protein
MLNEYFVIEIIFSKNDFYLPSIFLLLVFDKATVVCELLMINTAYYRHAGV